MNYYNEKNKLVGFDTEMAEAVTKKLGIDVEFTEINWDSKEVELSSKNIDCIWNGMCITEERKQNMSISDPYLYNTQAMVMKKSREKEIMKVLLLQQNRVLQVRERLMVLSQMMIL